MNQRVRSFFPDEPGELVFTSPDGREMMRVPHRQQQTPQPIEQQPGVTTSAFKRGSLQTASSFSNFAGMMSELVGADEMADSFYKSAEDFSLRAEEYVPTIGRVENIQSLGDVGVFAWEVLVENAPMLASMVIPGGLVGKAAGLLTKSAKAKAVAGTTAAFLSDVGIQTGESAGIAREHGESPVDLRVAGSGLGKAALDFAPLLGVANRIGITKNVPLAAKLDKLMFGELAERGFIRRAGRASAGIMAAEIPTEVTQEVMNIALTRAFSEYEGAFTPEEKSQMLNAAAGAAAFGLLGIPAGIAKPRNIEPTPPEDETPPNRQPGETKLLGRDTDFTLVDDALEGEWLPPDDSGGGAPPGLPDPTRRLTDGRPPGEFIYIPRLEDQSQTTDQSQADVKQAVEGEATIEGLGFGVMVDGKGYLTEQTDPMQQPADGQGPTAAALNLTAEQVKVAQTYPQYLYLDPASPEAQNIAGLHPGLQRALDLKAEIESDDDNYRTTDGQMKKAAKTRLGKLNARIAKIQKALGIEQSSYETAEATQENVEAVAPDPEPVVMTDNQKKRLLNLEEKESVEGLTNKEYEEYSDLMDIAVGKRSAKATTRHQTKEELAEVDAIAEAALEGDYKRTQKQAAGAKTVDNLKPKKGLSKEHAKTVLEKIAAKLKFGPRVRILDPRHPDAVKHAIQLNGPLRGFYKFNNPGEISIIPENNKDDAELVRTYVHEAMTHYGLRILYSAEELDVLINSMIRNPPQGIDIDSIRERQRNGETISIYMEMEEYIAQVAEAATFDPNTGLIKQPWWKRFIASLRAKLRKLYSGLRWTDNDINYVLRDVSKAMTGRITPRNYTVVRHMDKISQEILYWKEQRVLLNDYVEGRATEAPSVMFAADEITGPEPGDVPRAKMEINNKLKELRAEMAYAQKNQYFNIEAFGSVIGKENQKIANEAIASMFDVWGARFAKWFFTPLQLGEHYEIEGSAAFLEHVQQWWARKRTLTANPAKIAQKFQLMGARNQQKLSQVVLEMSIRSDEKGGRLTPEQEMEVFKEFGIEKDTELKNIWREMDESFREVVTNLRHGLMIHALRVQIKRSKPAAEALYKRFLGRHSLTPDQDKQLRQDMSNATYFRLEEIEIEMDQLLNRNYFPRSRFGNWAITVRAKKDMSFEGKVYKGPRKGSRGEVLYFETFATEGEQRKHHEAMQKKFPETSYEMQKSKLSEEEFHFMGTMSPQLYEMLNIRLEGLNETQRQTLKEIYLQQSPGRSFLRHLTQRTGIAGYSEDVLRVYSSYMMNVANHVARVEYHLDMNDSLSTMREAARTTVPDANVASITTEYFQDQFNYLMNPKNDLAQLRAFGFLWYLGFNVKSALVNLTQVPMVAHSFLASKYGDGRSAGAITKALGAVIDMRRGKVIDPTVAKALNRAIREGFVDESRATELAGLAEESTLQRLMPATKKGKLLQNVSYYGAFMFQKAERVNREITFIAAFNLAKENGSSNEDAFKAGREAVQTAMFEYAKWNRPKFMRGKKSVFFLFWQYMQGLSYMAFGGAGQGAAMRVWMMLLLAGGLQGLPFAENIFDILDYVGTKTKEKMGLDDPKVDLRNDLRELANELTDRPDLVMHGLSRQYGLGPLHLLGIAGLPVPNVDISGSISAGRVIPGTDSLLGYERDPAAKLGRTMADIFGPVAGVGYQFFRAATDNNPNTFKTWERAMPVALKSVTTAARRGIEGQEEYRGGGQVAEFDWMNIEHRAELIAQTLGFATTRLNQRYEADFAVENTKRYWAIRRGLVMENVAYARMAGDPEAIKDAREALMRFNKSVPSPTLRINGEQLMQSLKQRFRRSSLRERGLPSELLFRQIAREMRDLYPEASVDI